MLTEAEIKQLPLLAIGGCPRSGTTALVDLLNNDQRLFICRELRIFRTWKQPIGKRFLDQKLAPKKGPRHIFNLHKVDVNSIRNSHMTGLEVLQKIQNEVPNLSYYGDKMPRHYLHSAPQLAAKFPNMKFISGINLPRDLSDRPVAYAETWVNQIIDQNLCACFYAHSEHNFSISEWHELINILKNYTSHVMTLSQQISEVRRLQNETV
jgi:hypothetical protein